MEVKFYLSHDQYHLLGLLAREGGETVQQLLQRLVLKEDFERHISYDHLRRYYRLHECYCMGCFMKGTDDDTTSEMTAMPKQTKRLEPQ